MEREISYIASYPCPHCQAPLEGRAGRADSWLKCPRCGRASRPPRSAVTTRRMPDAPGPVELVLGPDPELPSMTPVAVAAPGAASASGVGSGAAPESAPNVLRVVYASALFVSVTMLLFSYLDRSVLGTSLFGASAVCFLVLLALPAPPTR